MIRILVRKTLQSTVMVVGLTIIFAFTATAQQKKSIDEEINDLFRAEECIGISMKIEANLSASLKMADMELAIYDKKRVPDQLQRVCESIRDVFKSYSDKLAADRKMRSQCKGIEATPDQEKRLAVTMKEMRGFEQGLCGKSPMEMSKDKVEKTPGEYK